MTAGRPSSYDPSFCERVIEYGRAGKSRAWIAAELMCTRQTLHNWEAAHPEFLDAMSLSNVLAQKWWEDAGQEGMQKPGFNGPVYGKSMAARFPDDWRDNSKVEHSGRVDSSVEHSLKDAPPEVLEWLAGQGEAGGK